jgi:type IV fimbrial biogenesis protein FimT
LVGWPGRVAREPRHCPAMKIAQHGFTLLELMTALAVLAVLAAIATPSFRQFSANSRTSASANSLVSALAVARIEALHQSTPVAICPSQDGQTCNATDWSQGWLVFTDGTGVKGVLDSNDQPVQAWPAPAGGVTVNLTSANNYVRFDTRGMNSEQVAATFKVSVAGCTGNNVSQIVVTAAGSPQSTKVACP